MFDCNDKSIPYIIYQCVILPSKHSICSWFPIHANTYENLSIFRRLCHANIHLAPSWKRILENVFWIRVFLKTETLEHTKPQCEHLNASKYKNILKALLFSVLCKLDSFERSHSLNLLSFSQLFHACRKKCEEWVKLIKLNTDKANIEQSIDGERQSIFESFYPRLFERTFDKTQFFLWMLRSSLGHALGHVADVCTHTVMSWLISYNNQSRWMTLSWLVARYIVAIVS